MSKRGGFPGGMGGFGGMNLNNLMKEAKKMQADMEKSQAELATKEFEASAGGGAVNVKVTGDKTIKEIKTIYILHEIQQYQECSVIKTSKISKKYKIMYICGLFFA